MIIVRLNLSALTVNFILNCDIAEIQKMKYIRQSSAFLPNKIKFKIPKNFQNIVMLGDVIEYMAP